MIFLNSIGVIQRRTLAETGQQECIMQNYKVFVYGTLKKGHGNHRLLAGSEFLGEGRTREKYALYSSGIPFAIKEEKVSKIQGELYLVNAATLTDLDRLEGHPGWYCREEISVVLEGKGAEVTAWLYFYPHPTGMLLPDGLY